MPKIVINEIDNTVNGLNDLTSNNIVYIPGNYSSGEFDKPYIFNSYKSFVETMGSRPTGDSPTLGSTWDYAYNILLLGFPVIAYRVTPRNENNEPVLPKTATAIMKADYSNSESTNNVATVSFKYEGTEGNRYSYSIYNSEAAVFFRVYREEKLIESKKLIDIIDGENPDTKRERSITAAQNLNSKYVNITISKEQKDYFTLTPIERVKLSGGTDPAYEQVQSAIKNSYGYLEDKYLYDVKFLTSGGYYEESEDSPEVDLTKYDKNITSSMLKLAETRTDCLAILDIPYQLPEDSAQSYFGNVSSSYATAYLPWINIKLPDKTTKWMPPGFVWLMKLAKSLGSGNKIWLPPAGITRASVTEAVKAEYDIGQAQSEALQTSNPNYINPIIKLLKYGYVIWGQRTLLPAAEGDYYGTTTSSLQELSVRLITIEIKKTIWNACLELTFEQNHIRTWNEFNSKVQPLLIEMKADGALYDYEIKMDRTTMTDDDINNNKVRGTVRISPTRAAEDWEIDFVLEPSGVTFGNDDELSNGQNFYLTEV